MARILLGTPTGEILDIVTATMESLGHEVDTATASFDYLLAAEEQSADIYVVDDDLGPQPLPEVLGLLPTDEDDEPKPVIVLAADAELPDAELTNLGVIAIVNKHMDSKEWLEELTRLLGEGAVSE